MRSAFLIAVTLLASAAQAADAAACYTISDPDARAYCLAKARQEPAGCYTVQRADLRAQCQAEVRR